MKEFFFIAAIIFALCQPVAHGQARALDRLSLYEKGDHNPGLVRSYRFLNFLTQKHLSGTYSGDPVLTIYEVLEAKPANMEASAVPVSGISIKFKSGAKEVLKSHISAKKSNDLVVVFDGEPLALIKPDELLKIVDANSRLFIVHEIKGQKEWDALKRKLDSMIDK